MKITCPKCKREGTIIRDFVSKGRKRYYYYRVCHYEGKKVKKCMLGRELPDELKPLEDKIGKKREILQPIMPEYEEKLKEIEKKVKEIKREVEIPEPKPVTGLSIRDYGRGDIRLWLSWRYPYQDPYFDRYEIYKSTSPNELGELVEKIDRQEVDAIGIDQDLSPNTTYYFTIRVYNKYGRYSEAKFPPFKTRSRLKLLVGKLSDYLPILLMSLTSFII